MTSLDQVAFDAAGFLLTVEGSEPEGQPRVWRSSEGDGLGLFYYAKPPDIESTLDDLQALRLFYRRRVEGAGLGVIEIAVTAADECRAVRTIFKAAQQPSGRTYIASLTLPFRDFSYVLKAQCEERGITGVRDTAILGRLIQDGQIELSDADGAIPGWLSDPYDANESGAMTRNRSEAEDYDVLFPDHPLSRARAMLRHLEATIRVTDEVKHAPPFVPAIPAAPHKPWWKLW